jgi:TPR repeat protein
MTGDLKHWKQLCGKAPWAAEGKSRTGHDLFVANDSMYLSGGKGRSLSGRSEQTEYDDIWRSEDGLNWVKGTGRAGITKPGHTLKSGNRYFYIKDHKQLYVSSDGIKWYRQFCTSTILGFFEDKIAMLVPNDRNQRLGCQFGYDLYFSEDGIYWKSDQNKVLTLLPWSEGKRERNSYRIYPYYERINYADNDGFDLIRFQNALWAIVMVNRDQNIYRTKDTKTWEKIDVTGKRFPLRSDAPAVAFDGYLWITGGVWAFDVDVVYEPAFSVFLTDVWRSKDGVNWEKTADRSPWGTGSMINTFSAKGYLYLITRGAYGNTAQGILREPFEIWRTKDGNKWEQVTRDTGGVHIQANDPDEINCVIETNEELYFLDQPQYRAFIGHNKSEIYIQASMTHEKFGVMKAILLKEEPPVFLRQGKDSKYFYRSHDLDGWERCVWKTSKKDGQQHAAVFPDDYEHMFYRPFVHENRLLMVGRKPSFSLLDTFEMLGEDEEKNAKALYEQGTLNYTGRVVPRDLTQAVKLWQKAAALGNSDAQFALGVIYDKGEGEPKNTAKAMEWWQKAAQQGHATAQYNLGCKYYEGNDVPMDLARAAQYYEKAAAQGNMTAQFNIGVMYEKGRGVPKAPDKAARWYRKAADNGFAHAQNNLGTMYYAGEGVPKNLAMATRWYQKSAAQGEPSAQKNLGKMYADGKGVTKDAVIAYAWYILSADRGDGEAKKAIDALTVSMTQSQRDDAKRLAAKWQKGQILKHE